jgi:S-DNA-T family DNA segregation ATPase FtsK/SpoIIIE
MREIQQIIAGTAFEIVARSLSSGDETGRNSFRIKNLTQGEALEFVTVWEQLRAQRSFEKIRLLVASDSHVDFAEAYRADPDRSITYYRNNNQNGLVYIETKVESDEQGLKNLFTLRDVNFLDGTFDEENEFIVAEEMVRQAMRVGGAANPNANELLRDRLVEVLQHLISQEMPVSVRKYAKFVWAAARKVTSKGAISPEETDALVGASLVQLDMFPDESWRLAPARAPRRLILNQLRAELAASASVDLVAEKVASDCARAKYCDEQGESYDQETQKFWRDQCSKYCLGPDRILREAIPYRIFEQAFNKDLKGLSPGKRVSEEILDIMPARKPEFDLLEVEVGLDKRNEADARKFLDSEPNDPKELPLKDYLSKQTRRIVEKLATPSVERIQNPLLKLAQIASDFRERHELDSGEYTIGLRLAVDHEEQYLPTIGLLAFLYGRSLAEIRDSLADGVGMITLDLDKRLTQQISPPPLIVELEDDSDAQGSSSSEEEGTLWPPLPLEFVLVDSSTGEEIDGESGVEWLPDEVLYQSLFWISVCGEDRCYPEEQLLAQDGLSGEAWIEEVAQRLTPLCSRTAEAKSKDQRRHPVVSQLIELRTEFRDEVEARGLSADVLNDTFDKWAALLADARRTFIPNGDIPEGMIEFLNADCVQGFDGNRLLMLQSHPMKLRWIAAYLTKSFRLATDAIEGSLRLNPHNEKLYLGWIENLSPHQQPAIHTSNDGQTLFADGERGWTENFQELVSSGGAASGERLHSTLVSEIVRQITAYVHAHPYKADGLRVLVVTGGASALPADIVQGVRKAELKNLSMTLEFVAPRDCWESARRQFELVDTNNRLDGEGSLFPPVQLNLHDFNSVQKCPEAELRELACDIAIVPQFLDDSISRDTKTEDEVGTLGAFDPLLDDPTYIASGTGATALWVSLRPQMSDVALSDWSTLVVRHERRNPVAADRPEAADFIDIRINFHNTARFFGTLHNLSHWVITVERHITREQIEKLETSPEVLSIKDGIGPGNLFTLIVSSNAGLQFIIDRLARKLKRVADLIGKPEMVDERATKLAERIYEEARRISPRLALDALGISRVTEEVLGLSVARKIADEHFPSDLREGFVAWVSLDEHPEWFSATSSMRADMIRLQVNHSDEGLEVDLLVLESKLRRAGYDPHGAEQVRKTLEMFQSILPGTQDADTMDGELWRDLLLGAIDTISDQALAINSTQEAGSGRGRSRVSEELRRLFRKADFASVVVRGLYSICEFTSKRELSIEEYDADPRVKIAFSGGDELLRDDNQPDFFGGAPDIGFGVEQGQVDAEEVDTPSAEVADNVTLHDTPENQEVAEKTEMVSEASEPSSASVPASDSGVSSSICEHLGIDELNNRYQIVLDTYGQYGINVGRPEASVDHAVEGPASILFRILPGRAVEPKKLVEKGDALKLALRLDASQEIRFKIDQGFMTIDVPKLDEDRYFVDAAQMWSCWRRENDDLVVPLGEDRFGGLVQINFTSSNSPHLLIGGTTGSGKSEALNVILGGIEKHYSPEEVRLHLIDPKGTELQHLSESAHLYGEIGWDEADAEMILSRAVEEMQDRYLKFKSARVRSLSDFNAQSAASDRLARWVVVLDEYADLTSEPEAKKKIEGHLKRLAQKARAAGIHVIIATQKPDASVISTNLRSNLPAQLALRVKSATESRVIMDDPGAETLTGKGDAFFKESGKITRVQCAKV